MRRTTNKMSKNNPSAMTIDSRIRENKVAKNIHKKFSSLDYASLRCLT
jgi:hypothetical protein